MAAVSPDPAAGGAGVLLDDSSSRVLDTRELPWEENPGIPGGCMQVLARDPDGHPAVLINWLPPGLRSAEPERHYHRTVRERGYVLEGELPMVEFDRLRDEPGIAVRFRPGFFMDRGPGCVHGLDPRGSGPTGFTILEWRTGPGTYLSEPLAAHESVVLPAPREVHAAPAPVSPGVVIDRDDLRLLDTRELPWEAADAGAVRLLVAGASGKPEVFLSWLPAGGAVLTLEATRALVLAGDARHEGPGATRSLRAGAFLDGRGTAIALTTAPAGAGCLLLGWNGR